MLDPQWTIIRSTASILKVNFNPKRSRRKKPKFKIEKHVLWMLIARKVNLSEVGKLLIEMSDENTFPDIMFWNPTPTLLCRQWNANTSRWRILFASSVSATFAVLCCIYPLVDFLEWIPRRKKYFYKTLCKRKMLWKVPTTLQNKKFPWMSSTILKNPF